MYVYLLQNSRQSSPPSVMRNTIMCLPLACKIGRFMIVWRYENGKESRWDD